MAKATKRIVKTPVTTIVDKPDGVTLELSQAEAQTLAEVIARVGGCPETSPRKHVDAIDEALVKVGVKFVYGRREKLFDGAYGSPGVHFASGSLHLVEGEA